MMSIVPSRFSRERRKGPAPDNADSPQGATPPAANAPYSALERFDQMRSTGDSPPPTGLPSGTSQTAPPLLASTSPAPARQASVREWAVREGPQRNLAAGGAHDASYEVEASKDEDVQIYIDPNRPIGSSSAILTEPEFAPDRSTGVGASAQEISGGVVTIMAPDFRPKDTESNKRHRGKGRKHSRKARTSTTEDGALEAAEAAAKAKSGNLVRIGVTGLATIAVLAVVGSRVLDSAPPPAPSQAAVATQWDEQLTDLVDFVQTTRGIEFSSPIALEALGVAEFRSARFNDQQLRVERDGVRTVVAETIGRALGISIDETALDTDVDALAVYLPATKRIIVRADDSSSELDDARRADVVGQLALALVDQQFSYTRPRQVTSQVQISNAIASADAQRVRDAWVLKTNDTNERGFQSAGSALAEHLIVRNGIVAMEPVLAGPPNTTEGLFDPTQSSSAAGPRSVIPPFVGRADATIGQDDVGPLTWLAVLSNDVDRATTLRAVYGWGGDTAIAFTRDDRACMAAAIRGDTPTDDAEIEVALTTWANAKPDNRTVNRVGNQIEVTACEPSAPVPVDTAELVASSLVVTKLVDLWSGQNINPADARCVALNTVLARADATMLPYAVADAAVIVAELQADAAAWAAHCDVYLPGISPKVEIAPATPFTVEKSQNPFRTTTTLG